ncbi:hypothetical protein GCM10009840_20650 [Pseudolysinimonas kribbensis]|uniref:DUF2207 domain-containing protein n=1 Tax=Pseudolysinimonas kribbensis TaxID=433641 RepID=A0ABQ6JYW8_9MICO|nr:DUF2207 domain-containing protein [Pseudolysinimonas kribbensis]GMA93510.1 hypothetical protein GCM10025881_03340 [Pseudolysinimonas kribbensis]
MRAIPRHRATRLLLAAVALGLTAGGIALDASPAHADDTALTFASFHADYTLGLDAAGHSTLAVTETIVADFPTADLNHGILRAVPSYDETTRVENGFTLRSVTDDGRPAHVDVSRDGDFTQLRIGDADRYVHGRHTYVIRYTQLHAAHPFDKGDDEFYWDVNGDGWGQGFGAVSTTVHLRDGLASRLTGRTACYPPPGGGECALQRTSDGFTAKTDAVGPYSTLTIAIGFRPHTFTPGPTPDDSWVVAVAPWVLAGLVAAIAVAIVLLRLVFWRDAPGAIIVPRYEPPEDIGVMSAAMLLHRDAAALPAVLVQFAVTGAARLVEDPDAEHDERYRLDLVDPDRLTQTDDRAALEKVFGGTQKHKRLVLDRSDRKLGDRLRTLQQQAHGALRARRLVVGRKSPLTTLMRWVAFLCMAGAVAIFLWADDRDVVGPEWVWLVLAVLVGAPITIAFAGMPERLSAKGSAIRDQLLGLRDYLELAEADRLRVLQSPQGAERTRIDPADDAAVVDLYERLLPWAMVWGVEGRWAKVLGEHYATTPSAAPSNLDLTGPALLVGLAAFSHSMQPSGFAATPTVSSSSSWSGSGSSSSFGGSFGGGFSGGGGGGGGGGGW